MTETECTQVGVGGHHSDAYYDGNGVCAWCGRRNKCQICGRTLDSDEDPFSLDCGNDCALCMLQVEGDMGNMEGALGLVKAITERINKRLEALASEDVNEVEDSQQPAHDA